jgi:hypothetical protein
VQKTAIKKLLSPPFAVGDRIRILHQHVQTEKVTPDNKTAGHFLLPEYQHHRGNSKRQDT